MNLLVLIIRELVCGPFRHELVLRLIFNIVVKRIVLYIVGRVRVGVRVGAEVTLSFEY